MIPAHLLNVVTTGDARKLSMLLPDESIDLIFTDPVYERMEDYRWLSETAMRVLKPNSAMLVWCGIKWLPETIAALTCEDIQYRWTLGAVRPKGFPSGRFFNKGFSNWQCCLWFEKGKSEPDLTISDITFSDNGGFMTYHSEWAKNIAPFMHWIYRFVPEGSVVLDTFAGGGTVPAVCKMLARNFVAYEIDPEKAEISRERLRSTQPSLFSQTEQLEMSL